MTIFEWLTIFISLLALVVSAITAYQTFFVKFKKFFSRVRHCPPQDLSLWSKAVSIVSWRTAVTIFWKN